MGRESEFNMDDMQSNVTFTFPKKENKKTPLERPALQPSPIPPDPITKKEQAAMRSEQSGEIRVGQEFKDEHGVTFKILKELGRGGMGGVYKVIEYRQNEDEGRERAIKFINAAERAQESMIGRFRREIMMLGKVESPFVLKAYDAGKYNVGGEEMAGLVTEVVDSSLDRTVKIDGKLDPDRIAVLMGQIALGLEDLRTKGIVHRDLKPENIFLKKMASGETLAKIGDFGLAKRSSDTDVNSSEPSDSVTTNDSPEITSAGAMAGTPVYLAPEYIGGKTLDHRTDLYSLGVLMYKLVSGHTPFEKTKDIQELYRAKRNENPPSFEQMGALNVPVWLKQIVFKLLERDPANRYQTAGEVFDAIQDAVKRDYPELRDKIPFNFGFDFKQPAYDDARQSRAA